MNGTSTRKRSGSPPLGCHRSDGRDRRHEKLLGQEQPGRSRRGPSELRRLEKERLRSLQAKQRRDAGGADAGVRPERREGAHAPGAGRGLATAAQVAAETVARSALAERVVQYGVTGVPEQDFRTYVHDNRTVLHGARDRVRSMWYPAQLYPVTWSTNSLSNATATWPTYTTGNTLTATTTNWLTVYPNCYEDATALMGQPVQQWAPVAPQTPEQQAAWLVENRTREEARVAQEAMRVTARARAKDLLLSCLTHEQRVMLEQAGKFRVVSNLGEVFEIVQGRQHNIFKLNAQGVRCEELCVHVAPFDIPDWDNMLAQKLCVETDVEDMCMQANIWSLPNKLLIHSAGRARAPRDPVAPAIYAALRNEAVQIAAAAAERVHAVVG